MPVITPNCRPEWSGRRGRPEWNVFSKGREDARGQQQNLMQCLLLAVEATLLNYPLHHQHHKSHQIQVVRPEQTASLLFAVVKNWRYQHLAAALFNKRSTEQEASMKNNYYFVYFIFLTLFFNYFLMRSFIPVQRPLKGSRTAQCERPRLHPGPFTAGCRHQPPRTGTSSMSVQPKTSASRCPANR